MVKLGTPEAHPTYPAAGPQENLHELAARVAPAARRLAALVDADLTDDERTAGIVEVLRGLRGER